MQFQNPEVFYFSFLLLIPLLVHLFQLQKFVKVPFTNVAFLKKIESQTRKSSTLKKWILLITRTLGLLAILFAFSGPYFSKLSVSENKVINIYLDNSLSVNTETNNGNLFQNTINDIIENAPRNGVFNLKTNSNFFENINYETLKKELLNCKISTDYTAFREAQLLFQQKIKTSTNTSFDNILITDLQNFDNSMFTNVTGDFSLISRNKQSFSNISIDSIYVTDKDLDLFELSILIKNEGPEKKDIPLAVYNGSKLVAKQSFSPKENSTTLLALTIKKESSFLGEIKIPYNDTFTFDNSFFFHLSSNPKTRILSIGKTNSFLPKIFTGDEFEFNQSSILNVNYNAIDGYDLIILNEPKSIPTTLIDKLSAFNANGGNLAFIPDGDINFTDYDSFFRKFKLTGYTAKNNDSLRITKINSAHPFFSNVFTKNITNFEYPTVAKSLVINSRAFTPIIQFSNNATFFGISRVNRNGELYVFGSSLASNNSNIQNSPLIIPIFYTLGKRSYRQPKLYYHIHSKENVELKTTTKKDEIVSLSNGQTEFIPLQRAFQNKVRLDLQDQSLSAGFYKVLKKKDTIATLAFNNPKQESSGNFANPDEIVKQHSNIKRYDSVKDAFTIVNENNKVNWLGKWFISLAIVSLLAEILLLKFFKV